MRLAEVKTRVKAAVFPDRFVSLRTPFGLAAGQRVHFNPQTEMRRYLGLDERELKPYFRKLVRMGDKCFDVGGNTGYYAVALAQMSKRPVVTFECDPAILPVLRRSCELSGSDIVVEASYVGDRDEPGRISLDKAAEKYFAPDFIKMDIEGAEADALRGARRLLSRRTTRFIIEVHGIEVEKACLDLLKRAGYTTSIVEPSERERVHRPLAHNRWVIAVP